MENAPADHDESLPGDPLPLDPALRHAFGTSASVEADPGLEDGDPAVGTILAGRYEILGERVRGGIGILFTARDEVLNRIVAIKLLRSEHRNRIGVARRFLAEAQVTGQLQHPGIAPVHDIGLAADGRPFLVMKLVQGVTLSEMLRDRKGFDIVATVAQVAEALAFAHDRGVLHRDVKPAPTQLHPGRGWHVCPCSRRRRRLRALAGRRGGDHRDHGTAVRGEQHSRRHERGDAVPDQFARYRPSVVGATDAAHRTGGEVRQFDVALAFW